MCGSGTILVEAACIALDVLPGSGRHIAFEKFYNFNALGWRELIQRRTPGGEVADSAANLWERYRMVLYCKVVHLTVAGLVRNVVRAR